MPPNPNQPPRSTRPVWLRHGEQVALGTLVLAGLLALGGSLAWRGLTGNQLIEIDRAPPLTARFQVDINSAQWPELAQLPGVGETISQKIVAEREAHGPYRDHEALARRVGGIGPRTLERIRPYLLPMPVDRNVAGGREAKLEPGG